MSVAPSVTSLCRGCILSMVYTFHSLFILRECVLILVTSSIHSGLKLSSMDWCLMLVFFGPTVAQFGLFFGSSVFELSSFSVSSWCVNLVCFFYDNALHECVFVGFMFCGVVRGVVCGVLSSLAIILMRNRKS